MWEIHQVRIGDPLYEPLIGRIRRDKRLRRQMWADAEHELHETPCKVWFVVAGRRRGRLVPLAWAAARVEVVDGRATVICSDNYERRGLARRCGLYRLVYAERHRTIVAPSGLPARSFLFPQPIPRHLLDGWRPTGLEGPGELPDHHWHELVRDPT